MQLTNHDMKMSINSIQGNSNFQKFQKILNSQTLKHIYTDLSLDLKQTSRLV